MSVNVDLVLSVIFPWGTTASPGCYFQNLAAPLIVLLMVFSLRRAGVSKFLLPLPLRHEQLEP